MPDDIVTLTQLLYFVNIRAKIGIMFADTATIEIKAGKGGDGRLSFRHEKYRAMGGPDGGNGGHGGDVIFRVDHNSNTLSSYRTMRILSAEDGEAGGENRRAGKQGQDVIVPLPQGTQVWDGETLVADLSQTDSEQVMAKGGRGGYGNAHFQSSVRQAPRISEQGEAGEHFTFRLELKMVADVGLVGLPNAGKSTLLSVISNARPEIADYAFTTLIPNLGVVDHRAGSFLAADIPGLIEGASAGKGLGDEFLRHVERTAVLIHLVDAGSNDVDKDWAVIQKELAEYKIDLSGPTAARCFEQSRHRSGGVAGRCQGQVGSRERPARVRDLGPSPPGPQRIIGRSRPSRGRRPQRSS